MELQGILASDIHGKDVDWEYIRRYLQGLPVATETNTASLDQHDPMGRSLIIDILSKDPPFEIVQETLKVYPNALVWSISAFFVACQSLNPDIIRIMICDSVKRQADTLSCPYPWITMGQVSVEATKLILNEYPQGVLQKTNGGHYCLLDRMIFSAQDFQHRKPDPSWWEKLKLMLFVAEHGKICCTSSVAYHPIHSVIRRALSKSEFFTNRTMAQHIVWLVHQLCLSVPLLAQLQDRNGDFPVHVALRNECLTESYYAPARDIIRLLIHSYRASARTCTSDGRLPLHLALDNGWPCHDIVFAAAPESIHIRDTKTGLYPFMMVACSENSCGRKRKRMQIEGTSGLDIVYAILRDDPLQAWGMLEG